MGGRAVYAQRGASLNLVVTGKISGEWARVLKTTMPVYKVVSIRCVQWYGVSRVDVSANEGAVDFNARQFVRKPGKLCGESSREGVVISLEASQCGHLAQLGGEGPRETVVINFAVSQPPPPQLSLPPGNPTHTRARGRGARTALTRPTAGRTPWGTFPSDG